ncbi:MAG TPA: 16S rRNA (adenine(1518)-N(6)/adenine(1519)-N(6))-dimethyltransferase RsmA [Dehalococcoidia bacterium]|nr:16S rRNA (adenine(1518)-N(6)/adenine(1519)-N(6))-dimethyltransferase RsmA [Dehalococcoidia bacterium]
MTTVKLTQRRPLKSLGQHFLADADIGSQIVAAADLTPRDTVVEVGPGRGFLTRRLVERAGRVIALELDQELAASLPQRLDNPSNLAVVPGDARIIDVIALIGTQTPYKVVANLPYYAANPILRHFLEGELKPSLMVVMLQREVAQSILAKPGGMGLLSVATQYYASGRLICQVPPHAFRPPPKVSSSVVRLDIRPTPAVKVKDTQALFNLVRSGFSAPRKQLRNSLSHGLGLDRTETTSFLELAGIDGRRRAETLSMEEWAQIYRVWEGLDAIAGSSLRQD